MHHNFLWRCQFTTAATRMLHNSVFLCILYRCLKSSRITTCDLGKEIVMNDILSCYNKMILLCNSCLLHRACATGYKIHWEEMLFSCKKLLTILLGHEGYTRFVSLIAYKKKKTENKSQNHKFISFFVIKERSWGISGATMDKICQCNQSHLHPQRAIILNKKVFIICCLE